MTTSGSTDYNLTSRELVTFALRKLNIVNAIENPVAQDMRDSIQALNLMLKGLQLVAPNLWRQTFGNVTLLANTSSYVVTPRPFRIHEMRYRDSAGRDIPMYELTREEYVELPLKSSTGIPTSYYIDYQRSAVTVYVWPVLASISSPAETLQFTYQRVFEDIDSANNDIDIPQEYFEVVGYMLADRLAETFSIAAPAVSKRAAMLMQDAMAADRESVVRFVPDRSR